MNPQIRLVTACICIGLAAELGFCQSQQMTGSVVVRRGKVLKFRLVHSLDSTTAKVGDDVPIRLARPLVADGVTLLKPGVLAHGKVTRVKRAGADCKWGEVHWNVDGVSFADSSKAETEKNSEVPGDYEPPDMLLNRAIRRGHHNVWKWTALSPLIVLSLPFILLLASTLPSEPKCTTPGSEYVLSENATIVVVITKNHRVHY